MLEAIHEISGVSRNEAEKIEAFKYYF